MNYTRLAYVTVGAVDTAAVGALSLKQLGVDLTLDPGLAAVLVLVHLVAFYLMAQLRSWPGQGPGPGPDSPPAAGAAEPL